MFRAAALILSLIIWLCPLKTSGYPVQAKLEQLSLNGNLIEAKDKSKTFFLILHGTFASHQMEIITSLQSLLEEEGYGSLAITLGLGENNRKGFLDCSKTIIANHADAENEISQWFAKLKHLGYKKIALIGHSRGGSQVASFARNAKLKISALYLIAPMIWSEKRVHSTYLSPLNLKLDSILGDLQQNPQKILRNHNVLHCKGASVTAGSFLSYYDAFPEKHTPTLIKNTQIPTKIYLGDSDELTDNFLAHKSEYEENPYISTKIIEDADHFFRDFAVEDVVTDILQETD